MSPFKVVQAIQSAGVGVVGLDLRRTVVVFRSIRNLLTTKKSNVFSHLYVNLTILIIHDIAV